MGEIVLNPISFNAGLDAAVQRFERKWIKRNRMLVSQAMRRLIAKTPVYTGQTVRNYVASNGSPASGGVKSGQKPVERTNSLALGTEQLRGGAAAEATTTIASVNFSNPYDIFFITNKSPAVAGLEIGALPVEPFKQRSPAGMFGVTLQELSALADSGIV